MQKPAINWVGHGCVDFTMMMLGDPPETGHLRLINPSGVSLGGSAFNKAVAGYMLSDFFDHHCVAPVGNDIFGMMVKNLLADKAPGLKLNLVPISEGQTSHSYVEVRDGDRSFRHHPGVNDLCDASDLVTHLNPSACATIFGYPALMSQMLINNGAGTKCLFKAAPGLRVLDMVSVDPDSEAGNTDWANWHENVMPHIDLYCPSAEELLFMLDREHFDQLSRRSEALSVKLLDQFGVSLLDRLAREIIRMGCPMVLIKIGPRGAYLATSHESVPRLPLHTRALWTGRELWAPAYREKKFVSSTGAGDAAIATFVIQAMLDGKPEHVLASSVAAGAFCVESVGATDNIPTITQLDDRMRGWPQLDCNINEGCGAWRDTSFGKIWAGNKDITRR